MLHSEVTDNAIKCRLPIIIIIIIIINFTREQHTKAQGESRGIALLVL
jgi:hypothetical protein